MATKQSQPAGDDGAPAVNEPVATAEMDGVWSEEGSDLITWVYRTDEDEQVTATRKSVRGHKYIAQLIGDIDPDVVRRRVGGGSFRLVICRGRVPLTTRYISVEAPRREFDVSDAPAPAPDPETPKPMDAAQLATIVSTAVAEAIKAALPAIAPVPAQPALTFENVLAMAKELRGGDSRREHEDPIDTYTRMKPLFDEAKREGGSGRSIGDAISESMPHLVDMVDRVVTARVATAAAIGAQAARVSQAPRAVAPARPVAVAPAAAAPSTPAKPAEPVSTEESSADQASQLTMIGLADQVARALRHGTGPDDFADAIELQFSREEIALVASLGPEQITTIMRAYAGHYPELGSESVQAYVTAVLKFLTAENDSSHAEVIEDKPAVTVAAPVMPPAPAG